MSELIGEIEAFTAWKNGQDVEIYDESMCWHPLLRDHGLCVFDSNGRVKFRLKQKTTTLNGIEVPAPFKPKSGDMIWCLIELSEKGYEAISAYDSDDFTAHIAYWRTEDEIKQVVAALRKIFVINNQ